MNKLAIVLILVTVCFSVQAKTEKIAVKEDINSSIAQTHNKQRPVLASKSLQHEQHANPDFWFYDTWVTLNTDLDYDGFASSMRIEIDADTYFSEAQVYAVVYIGTNNLYSSIHITSDFILYGDSSDDIVILDIDLLTGYPANDYDILIELYDAFDESLLAVSSPNSDADLAYQPLESRNFDTPDIVQQVVVEHHGGSLAIWFLIPLTLLGALRRRAQLIKNH